MDLATLPSWVRERIAEESRQKSEVLAAICAGIHHSDPTIFHPALVQLDLSLHWRAAMLAIRRCRPPSAAFRRWFRDDVWLRNGDHIRSEVGDDLLLVDALRVLMPPYRGPALRLWRGEGFWNRRRRTYGMSWSLDRGIADAFAQSRARLYQDGTVLLEADAPAAAIICKIPKTSDGYREREVLVDRRRLAGVRTVARHRRAGASRPARC